MDDASFQPLERPGFANDAETVHVNGNPIAQADPATFRLRNANFESSADAEHACYRNTVIAGADPRSFPQGRAATGCTETPIAFAG